MKQEREEVYAVPCSRAFVVAPEKAEEFKNQKPNPEIRKQIKEMAETFRVNNLTQGPVLQRKVRLK